MTHPLPLVLCKECKKTKVKRQGHGWCYQCNKRVNPPKKKGGK